MKLEELRNRNLIILECISGSKAYGLDTPNSDTDIKGVFILPKDEFYSLDYIPQVQNETNDIVFYELGRFMELLSLNNPNILELLNTPESSVIYKHPYLKEINSDLILSKLCADTFGKFAASQLKKAKGLKKKIVNPVEKERKNILQFCFVQYQQGAVSLEKFLEIKKWNQKNCGLVKIPHMTDVYGLYYSDKNEFQGILKKSTANDVCLSSIPKEKKQEALLYFNRNGYSSYCKDYHEYWSWVEKRNEERYSNTQSHGKNYDAKNMMHVFRLLEMAIEIAQEKKVIVKRPNRDFLLNIKKGLYEYTDLIKMAETKMKVIEEAFASSALPLKPNLEMINEQLVRIRKKFYKKMDLLK